MRISPIFMFGSRIWRACTPTMRSPKPVRALRAVTECATLGRSPFDGAPPEKSANIGSDYHFQDEFGRDPTRQNRQETQMRAPR